MITAEDFRTLAKVDLNASTTVLESALAKNVKAEATAQIAQALIIRTLVAEHSWEVGQSAAKVGLSASQASIAGARGKVLYETGAASATIVWQTVRTLSGKVLTDLAETLQGMTGEEARTEYVIAFGAKKVAADRLRDNATPERVEALAAAIIADGHRTPVAARGVVDGIASRLEIPLPKKQQEGARPGAADKATTESLPTFDQAMTAALAAVKRLHDAVDEGHALELTPAQARLVDDLMAELIAVSDAAKVSY